MRFRIKFVIGILLLHLLSGYNLHPVFGSDTGGYSDSYALNIYRENLLRMYGQC